MRRFGPSGSWKKNNKVLEHRNAVITKRSEDFFVDANGIDLIILLERGCFAASLPVSLDGPILLSFALLRRAIPN